MQRAVVSEAVHPLGSRRCSQLGLVTQCRRRMVLRWQAPKHEVWACCRLVMATRSGANPSKFKHKIWSPSARSFNADNCRGKNFSICITFLYEYGSCLIVLSRRFLIKCHLQNTVIIIAEDGGSAFLRKVGAQPRCCIFYMVMFLLLA